MKKYEVVTINKDGVKKKSTIAASNEAAVMEKSRENGETVIALTEKIRNKTWFWERPHLSFQQKLLFTNHMATMLKMGIPITEALKILMHETDTGGYHKLLQNILERIEAGQTLGKSLAAYPNIFSDLFVNMVQTGEESGTLVPALEHLSEQLEKQYEIRSKIVGAFIYPAVIIGITLILMLGIMIFVMPKITEIFVSLQIPLPLPTRIMIAVSRFLIETPLKAIGLGIGTITFFMVIKKIKALRPLFQSIFMHIPVFGKILKFAYLAVFARTMNSLLESGIPIIKALSITGNMMTNDLYKKAIQTARDKVEQGGKLGESLSDYENIFPRLSTMMLSIGEATGSLETTTKHLADLYERNVNTLTKNLSVLLEPILLVLMGGLIGGIALSIILPIYQLPNLLNA